MKVDGKHFDTIWLSEDKLSVKVIDQRWLPHKFIIETLTNTSELADAIEDMHVRGAGLIGATAGYGMYLAGLEAHEHSEGSFMEYLQEVGEKLKKTRPTAVNLEWAVNLQIKTCKEAPGNKVEALLQGALKIANDDKEFCRMIGQHGSVLIEEIARQKEGPVNILTHCNAGWLAFVDYGSATSPIYTAFDKGIDLHVWVDETRPRNQGARLTAWELGQHGIPHTVIPDNTGGHLMQHGLVDMVIVGSDRTTANGDVANKIGTYLKALAAKDNNIPFYTALPSSTFDWELTDGVKQIPIEQRPASEVQYIQGLHDGEIKKVLLTPENSNATNFGFDVTPARLVTGLITERGVCEANKEAIAALYS